MVGTNLVEEHFPDNDVIAKVGPDEQKQLNMVPLQNVYLNSEFGAP